MKVTDFSKYRGKRALVLIGTDDVDHPRELDMRIADWLNENGANADFWFLGDRGASGKFSGAWPRLTLSRTAPAGLGHWPSL
jgi:hypothetical protein